LANLLVFGGFKYKNMANRISNPILVTGGSGFVGANLVRRLISDGYDVYLILRPEADNWRLQGILDKVKVHKADLTKKEQINDIVQNIKPKTIFHLAAYGAYPFQTDPERIEAVNLDGTIILLSACEKEGFDIFINSGSSSEYGFKDKPMKETDVLEPNSSYAVFKSAATLFCKNEAQSKKLPIITLRPFSVYGPYEEKTRLIPTLIMKFLQNECPPLASPETARDFIYVDDVVDLYLMAANRPELSGETFNVGTGFQTTLREIVDITKKMLKAKIKPKWNTMEKRSWDQSIWQANMSKTKKTFNWKPKYNLATGLEKTVEWFKNNLSLYK
jgi:nucleoside-diphosphate-sugar epimerase